MPAEQNLCADHHRVNQCHRVNQGQRRYSDPWLTTFRGCTLPMDMAER